MTGEWDEAPARAPWLITLADLALLLVGFFVFLQASRPVDPGALAQGFRQGFGIRPTPAAGAQTPAAGAPTPAAGAPMPVAITRVSFTSGSAMLSDVTGLAEWARDVARDPRTRLTLTGTTDGSAEDVDPMTGSAAILAADRARAVASQLAFDGVPPDRVAIATAVARERSVTLALGFAGAGESPARPQ